MAKQSRKRSTRATRREKNQRQILGAAERLFYEKGFSPTPLREIIKESGLSTTVFYSFFPSKLDLLVALILPLGEEINRKLNAAFKNPADEDDPIEKAIHIALQVYARHRRLTKIYVSETAAQNLHSRGPLRRVMDSLKELVTNQLRIGVAKGYFIPVDPIIFAYSFIAMINMHLYRWAVLGELSRKEMLAGAGALAQVFRSGVAQDVRRELPVQ
jgi:AcrR family transcriptional regulator